jgi:fumarylacetoacetate (FAA) hydrolase
MPYAQGSRGAGVKLATLRIDQPKSESERRDGQLVLVDDAKGLVLAVPTIAPNLLAALRAWEVCEPKLRVADKALREGKAAGAKPLAGCKFMAPLPRSTCWIDGSAYINHVILVRKARGAEPPADLRETPLMYQGCSDPMLAPDDPIEADEAWGPDLEAEVGVILDDVPRGTKAKDALKRVRLLALLNDISLRNLIPRELAAGFGFYHGKPPTAFAPYAVTPDELGAAWKDARVHLPLLSHINGKPFGHPDAGPEMFFGFDRLIEHAAHTRPLPAGTVLGSGTVSNEDASKGFSCIAEVRMLETIQSGKPKTPFLRHGDTVRIEMKDATGRSVFGAIEQKVVPLR